MPTITAKSFDQEMQALLSEITSSYHSGEMGRKEQSELPDDIYLIEAEDEMVGFGVIWEYANGNQLIQKAEQEYFSEDERYLEKDFYIDIKNKTNIIFIEALDVLKEFEGQGHGAFFIDWLKARYPNQKLYVYSLEKSKNFWYKQNFEVVGSTMWMSYN